MDKTSNFIIKYRWLIIIAFPVIAILFAMQIPKTEVDPSMKGQLPEDIHSRVVTDRIDDIFGGTDIVMIVLKTDDVLNPETLKRTKLLTKKMKRIKGVDKVLSLFELKSIKGEDGAMIVNPAVRRIPKTNEQREILRDELKDNDMVYGSVVSEDFVATAVIGMLKTDVSDDSIIAEIHKIIEETPGEEEAIIGGLPFVRYNISRDIKGDMSRLMPYALVIMLVFLFISFRQLRGVLLPFAVVIMSVFFAMGLISFIGWKIQMMTVLLPIMLVAIANNYGIHLIARYQEDNVAGGKLSRKELAKSGFITLSKPILVTGITTSVGMLCLLGHVIISAEQLGVLAAAGILFALVASLLFIPAILSVIPKSKPIINPEDSGHKVHFLERMLGFFGEQVSTKSKAIIIVSLIVTAIAAIGIFSIVVDTNPENYYTEDSPVVHATRTANEYFGGSTNISIVFKGDIKDPDLMNRINDMESRLGKMPEVGNTTSIARVVRQMSRALNDKDESGYDEIPKTRNAVAQYFELYSMSGDPDDFEKMIDFPYEHAQVSARIKEISTTKINSVVNTVNEMTKDDENVELVGGFATILAELARLIVRGQLISLTAAMILVGILMMLLFRSFFAGIISITPLALSMVVLFGLMGFFHIELNVITALLSSIMIGVGIDYTIHFLWRYKDELAAGLSYEAAVKKTLTTTGRGIVFNALSVIIGFAALLVSNFLPVKFFGFLVVVSISACLVGALILIPAMCIVFKPKFLEPKLR
ncbi:MAG: MMPL family transporter [Candidatus Hatepunaea meridiana]|nr:MMPL family transporter [Candidatus Hatepunaea meridiana]